MLESFLEFDVPYFFFLNHFQTKTYLFINIVNDDRKEMKERIERAVIKNEIERGPSRSEERYVKRNITNIQVKSEFASENEPVVTKVAAKSATKNPDFVIDSFQDEFQRSQEHSAITRPKTVKQYSHEASKKNVTSPITDFMKQQIIKEMNSLLLDVRKHKKVDDEYADCGLWDFAGERDYYATHQTFMTKNAIYIIVADVSKDIKETVPDTLFDSVGGIYIYLKYCQSTIMYSAYIQI